LAAERAGLIDKIKHRGDPKFAHEPGFEFTTKSGRELDVKAFRAGSLSNPKELAKFKNKLVNNNVEILVDPRNLSKAELNVVIQRAESVGISKTRFIIPDQKFFNTIVVNGKRY